MEDHFDFICKIVLVGDSSVGKSGLMKRFTKDTFSPQQANTIGIELAHKTITVKGKLVKAQLWDTGGQEKFRCITAPYYRGALGAVIVYDITNRTTFQSLGYWIEETKQRSMPEVTIILIGNKTDRGEERQVSAEEGREFANAQGLPWIETSAKEGTNVSEAFMQLADYICSVNHLSASTTSLKLDKSSFHDTKKRRLWC